MRTLLAAVGLAFSASVCAAPFGNDIDSSWADTPKGRFECHNGKATNYLQVLKLGGRLIFEEKPGPSGVLEGVTLSDGIMQANVGCPNVVANEKGFVVLVRDTAPPSYGVQGYAIVDFSAPEPRLFPLCDAQRPWDDKITDKQRLVWSSSELSLRYFGYRCGESGTYEGAPKPKMREVRFDFSSGSLKQVK